MGISGAGTESGKETKVLELVQQAGITLKELHDVWVLFHALIDKCFGVEAELFLAATFLRKRIPVKVLNVIIVLGMSKLDDVCKELLEENHGKANSGQR